jgi:diacylglycerol kinase (ATP)
MSQRPLRVKFIFNPGAGKTGDSPNQLVDILSEMHKHMILPEVYLMKEGNDPKEVIKRAGDDGTRLIVVSGGDGTIEHFASEIVNHDLTLGIIPTGTRNNLALNLGIPSDIPAAVKLLRQGNAKKIDVGLAKTQGKRRAFLEVVTLGLLSDLYFVTDEIQHGDLSKLGEFISTLVASTPFTATIKLDGKRKLKTTAFIILIANMQYLGANIQIDPSVSYHDGKLDVFVFSELSKINLVSFAIRSMAGNTQDDSVRHYRAKEIVIESKPSVANIADGFQLTDGKLSVTIKPRALRIIAGRKLRSKSSKR